MTLAPGPSPQFRLQRLAGHGAFAAFSPSMALRARARARRARGTVGVSNRHVLYVEARAPRCAPAPLCVRSGRYRLLRGGCGHASLRVVIWARARLIYRQAFCRLTPQI